MQRLWFICFLIKTLTKLRNHSIILYTCFCYTTKNVELKAPKCTVFVFDAKIVSTREKHIDTVRKGHAQESKDLEEGTLSKKMICCLFWLSSSCVPCSEEPWSLWRGFSFMGPGASLVWRCHPHSGKHHLWRWGVPEKPHSVFCTWWGKQTKALCF